MKDFVNRSITVGDTVVHGVGGRFGGLSGPYDVIGLTLKMVRISKVTWAGRSKVAHPANLVVVASGSVE